MTYNIVYTKQALKAFKGIPKDTSRIIRMKLEQIAEDPFTSHHNVTKLQGRDGYRLRQGDWRVIYEIQKEKILILVLDVALRKEVYR